ncbi:phosphate signaling complex protein PhoU [Alteribacter aurantiacus]|uniref:phosphate signaling complex protein PhoU n=1 Tax=Alteribacter aurantiacus TaxID=254410 RepID=UPI0003FAF5BA|nr:phosphate signaling complex protein PhoU [Alteribacter aurantiacus]
MTVRGGFVTELGDLKEEVMMLGSLVQRSLADTMKAIDKNNYSLMEDIIEHDKVLNELELEINERATLMIAKQQPVASDLRRIIVSLKVSSDLERMGDLAVDMAKAAQRLTRSDACTNHVEALLELATKAEYMLQEVLKAYKKRDMLSAQRIAAMDDEVDRAYGQFVKGIFKITVSNEKDTQQITQLAFISRYIERIADYCTNIAEWIIYEVNGKRFDLN